MTPFERQLPKGRWSGAQFPGEPSASSSMMALHGFSGCGHDFEIIAPKLHGVGKWIAPNLPGHGSQLKACPGTIEDWMEGLEEFMIAQMGGPSVVLGYSLGGRVALHFALKYPQLVEALILIGATAGIADESERQARYQSDQELAEWIEANGIDAFCERWRATPIIATQEAIPAPYGDDLRARKKRLSAEGLTGALRAVGVGVLPSVWDRLEEIEIPTLVMVGESDSKYLEIGQELIGALPKAKLELVRGAGHAAHLESSTEAAPMISDFIDSFAV